MVNIKQDLLFNVCFGETGGLSSSILFKISLLLVEERIFHFCSDASEIVGGG